jgi:hypothetical protein
MHTHIDASILILVQFRLCQHKQLFKQGTEDKFHPEGSNELIPIGPFLIKFMDLKENLFQLDQRNEIKLQ